MPMIPELFERIPDSFDRSAGSPDPSPDFRGLVLAGPSRITLSEGTSFPVCGTYQVTARFFNRFRSLLNEIVVVAVDAATHAPRATNLLKRGFDPVESGFDPSQPDFDDIVVTGWFNLDLFRWMDDLPRRPGRYIVFATVGDVASNAITVELAQP